jgi:hypothetical protein
VLRLLSLRFEAARLQCSLHTSFETQITGRCPSGSAQLCEVIKRLVARLFCYFCHSHVQRRKGTLLLVTRISLKSRFRIRVGLFQQSQLLLLLRLPHLILLAFQRLFLRDHIVRVRGLAFMLLSISQFFGPGV